MILKASIIIEMEDGSSEELYYDISSPKYKGVDDLFKDMAGDIRAKAKAFNEGKNPLGVLNGQLDLVDEVTKNGGKK